MTASERIREARKMQEASMEDETYNGWKNYPTWAVNMWLSNDEGLYNEALDIARDTHATQIKEQPYSEFGQAVLAESYRQWVCDELAPDLGATFAADLLGYALGEVDWFEIAGAWLEQVTETA